MLFAVELDSQIDGKTNPSSVPVSSSTVIVLKSCPCWSKTSIFPSSRLASHRACDAASLALVKRSLRVAPTGPERHHEPFHG